MSNVGRLILRLVVGTLLAGHGAQKLFGWFEGPGLKGTHGFMETLGMRPGKVWGTMAAVGEFSGGILTALGALSPLGPLNIAAAMTVAIRRAHWNKPIWAAQGGAELALINLSAAVALLVAGPGRFSVDHALGTRLPRWMGVLAGLSTVGVVYAALERPEIGETVMNKVNTFMPNTEAPVEQSDLEVETVPVPEAEPVLGT